MPDLSAMSLEQLREHLESTGLVRRLIELAREEDLGRSGLDVTSIVCKSEGVPVEARIIARGTGVAAGVAFVGAVLDQFAQSVVFHPLLDDGERFEAGQTLGTLYGSRRQIVVAERTILNMLGRLCGIATHTARFVEAMRGPSGGVGGVKGRETGKKHVKLLDTRKTTPGFRVFEKYAVRCGGGHCHRLGLHDAVLIKDNHLAGMCRSDLRADAGHFQREVREVEEDREVGKEAQAPARAPDKRNHEANVELHTKPDQVGEAVAHAARLARERDPAPAFVEVEADSLEQVAAFLAIEPGLIDIILLDNMPPAVLREAIAMRDKVNRAVLLEASGGITLETIATIAATGVDRISCGSLTHGAVWIDIGLDMGESISMPNTGSDTGTGEG